MGDDDVKTESGQEPDKEIVRRVLSGNGEAYALLIDRHQPALRRFLTGRGLRGMTLEDVAQEAFINVYKSLGNLKNGNRFGAYLLTSAARLVIDKNRLEKRNKSTQEIVDVVELADKPRSTKTIEIDEALQTSIADLPDTMQVVLGLKYAHGKSASQIASILGQSVNTVTKTMSRAYDKLRRDPRLRDAWEEK